MNRLRDRLAELLDRSGTGDEKPRGRGPCPQCGAAADKRVDSCGFGQVKQTLCGVCAYEFPEER